MDKESLYGLFKCIALALFAEKQLKAGDGMINIVIPSLVFACVIALQFFLSFFHKMRKWIGITDLAAAAVCLFFNPTVLILLFVVFITEVTDLYAEDTSFYWITACAGGIAAFIAEVDGGTLFEMILVYAVLYFSRSCIAHLIQCRETMEAQRAQIKRLEEKLQDNRQYMKTLQDTAALEERNRLAARLHDKVGHGISGSIIMLEASMLILDQDKEKAKEGISRAVAHLRDGVDDIRAALREERPVIQKLGMHEIKKLLEEFQINHDRKARLTVCGNVEMIDPEVLSCIYDNTKESLTNLLKHSDATIFELRISRKNKVTAVEYKDNGTKKVRQKELMKGLGIQAMEERTIKAGGRFFLNDRDYGFMITNIFIDH
ncbi:MAG: hypothetical protein E7256_04825 [Lachnospiraceae bacterium]|nr:hypothetical protein [Lachnospiraceae bacterium]